MNFFIINSRHVAPHGLVPRLVLLLQILFANTHTHARAWTLGLNAELTTVHARGLLVRVVLARNRCRVKATLRCHAALLRLPSRGWGRG